MFSRKPIKFIAIGAVAVVLAGGAYGIVSASSSSGSGTATAASSSSLPFAHHGGEGAPYGGEGAPFGGEGAPHGGKPNARSGPAAGGATGTVAGVSTSGFTLSTAAAQEVTVDETSSTTYRNGTGPTSAGAVKAGESVLVLGMTDGTTITAAVVVVQPSGGGEPDPTAAEVVPFQQGAPSASKQVGQVPADYSEGSGTIVGGTEANRATEAALAAYPGGIVDRVVKLSNGEYEVHNIGVNWPHHVFVNQDFKVVGAG
jgi:hypothetical protein